MHVIYIVHEHTMASECAPAMNYDFKFYTLIALYGALVFIVRRLFFRSHTH